MNRSIHSPQLSAEIYHAESCPLKAIKMKFAHPSYLFLFWLVPALIFFYLYAFRKKDKLIKAFCGETLYAELVPSVSPGRQKLKAALLLGSLSFLVVSLHAAAVGFSVGGYQEAGD